ncbi:MAG: type II toxin-antitoxin system VapC family toxin [Nitrososphaerales archaeon]
MTVLIDSWAWIEYWKGGQFAKQAAAYIEGDEDSVVSTINLAEVFFWVSRYYDEPTASRKLLTVEKRCHLIPVERDIAIAAAKIKREQKLALADSLILATARHVRGRLVTGDSDLKGQKEVIFLAGK